LVRMQKTLIELWALAVQCGAHSEESMFMDRKLPERHTA
jgi:hypothetical protein